MLSLCRRQTDRQCDRNRPTAADYWWGRQNAAPLKFDPKPSEATFSVVFLNFDKYRPEVADDVISGVTLDYVSVDVLARVGDSRLNSGLIIRLFGWPDQFCAL